MTTLVSALKSEIQRLARKEVKSQMDQTKRQVTEQRKAIASLRRQNADLERRLKSFERQTRKSSNAPSISTDIPEGSRFSARSLRAQRRRTGLSQANYATLVGVSTLTVNNWELEKTRPRDAQFAKLISLRGLGKRDAEKLLEKVSK